ncbi:MAG: hypothetical protein GF383_12390 [Candidatus Lokiarchaeota archaeon]|nr:hypothetical protein [Candidatus Lokiarchaeota archaeon]MBD3341799.1 hypothetical protein [Candidatus Lokiarchaeota archaeon]
MEPIIHHVESDHPEYNESYYFAFYNNEENIGGVSRIGFKPNKKEGMTFFFLFLPDGSTGGYFQEKKIKSFTNKLKVGGMHHKWNPDGAWNYTFNGKMIFVKNSEDLPRVKTNPKLISDIKKIQMDLKFEPINDPYEYSKHMTKESLELGKKAGDKHWEQIALINGSISMGDEEITIENTMGQRDHTYGIRDWTGVGNWLYYVVWFNKNLAINPAAIISTDGKLSTGGFLFKNGENIPLQSIKILDQQFRSDGIFPTSSKLEIIDNNGVTHVLKATVGPIIPIPFADKEGKKSILVQSFGSFELDDITEGYGTFETLRKAPSNYI